MYALGRAMSNCTLRQRQGLGPGVDSHFDAAVGRAVSQLQPGRRSSMRQTGYIELVDKPYAHLVKLFEVLYRQPRAGSRIPYRMAKSLGIVDDARAWMQVRQLRYLTTDVATGIALPLYDLNPDARAGLTLAGAIAQLDAAGGGRLKNASLIGLTVEFELGIIADRLEPVLAPGAMQRLAGRGAHIDQALNGGSTPYLGALARLIGRAVGVQRIQAGDVGLSCACSPQLHRAMRELRTGDPNPPPRNGHLDYGIDETGAGVIVGIVDFGCDFAHESFRTGALRAETRILALWDQNGAAEQPSRQAMVQPTRGASVTVKGQRLGFDYGRLFTKGDIDRVLAAWLAMPGPRLPSEAYARLDYHPHDHHYTARRPGVAGERPLGAHGTSVMEIAVGGCRSAGHLSSGDERDDDPIVRGAAPNADIVFVQVRTHGNGRKALDVNDVVDAVAFIFHFADSVGKACVVNLSLNTMSGPHDGDGYFERRLASLLRSGSAGPEMRGRAVVVAAGNVPDNASELLRWQHLSDSVQPGRAAEFHWRVDAHDRTPNSVEIWYTAAGALLQVWLQPPDGARLGPVLPGRAAELLVGDKVCGSVIGSRVRPAMSDDAALKGKAMPGSDSVDGRHVILVEIEPDFAQESYWTIVLEVVDRNGAKLSSGAPIDFHAWLERDDEGQSGLCRRRLDDPIVPGQQAIAPQDRLSTIGTLSCGADAIVVGAYSTSSSGIGDALTGCGPARGGREKPDLAAPGNELRVIVSAKGLSDPGSCSAESGTSLAAPFVTGAIACMYQAADEIAKAAGSVPPPRVKLDTVRMALTCTARPPESPWNQALGHGRLNTAAALDYLRSHYPD